MLVLAVALGVLTPPGPLVMRARRFTVAGSLCTDTSDSDCTLPALLGVRLGGLEGGREPDWLGVLPVLEKEMDLAPAFLACLRASSEMCVQLLLLLFIYSHHSYQSRP